MMFYKLRNLILARFRTQSNFAATLDVSDSKVSRVIRGTRKIGLEEQIQWTKILGSPVRRQDLFSHKTILSRDK